ncbi:MAG: glycosyl transferase family protein [Gammaproteobacteria bacterium]|nr:glycosyl transferase family protein [Gammaproteobacteria bacterium]
MYTEHPFAQYVRILGKGKNGSRSLTFDEAYESMKLILADQVTPEQLGAFLMLLRVKEETPEEVAGFVKATKESISTPSDMPKIDLDWSSYAGKKRQLPWYILASLLLADNGITTFMHGAAGHTPGRVYTKDIISKFGITGCKTMKDVKNSIASHNFAYMDIEYLSPLMHKIIELRPFLGLRSPVHTVSRMLDPFSADYVIQGIFHPGYRPMHQEAALLLGMKHVAVVKGDGGEIERNPDMACLVQSVSNETMSDEEWPPMFPKRHMRDDEMDTDRLIGLWNGTVTDEYGDAAVIGTIAITLKLMGRADSIKTAESLASEMWQTRQKNKYDTAA